METATGQADLAPNIFSNYRSRLGGSDVEPHRILVLHHDSITAEVDLSGIGVSHVHHASGADEASTVILMPQRGGEFPHIDVIASKDIFKDRARFHFYGRYG